MNTEKTYSENLLFLAATIKVLYLNEHFTNDLNDAVYECVDNALIYYAAQYYVMSNTRNEDAYFDNNGSLEDVSSFQEVITACSFDALYEDVQDYLDVERWERIKEYLTARQDRRAV